MKTNTIGYSPRTNGSMVEIEDSTTDVSLSTRMSEIVDSSHLMVNEAGRVAHAMVQDDNRVMAGAYDMLELAHGSLWQYVDSETDHGLSKLQLLISNTEFGKSWRYVPKGGFFSEGEFRAFLRGENNLFEKVELEVHRQGRLLNQELVCQNLGCPELEFLPLANLLVVENALRNKLDGGATLEERKLVHKLFKGMSSDQRAMAAYALHSLIEARVAQEELLETYEGHFSEEPAPQLHESCWMPLEVVEASCSDKAWAEFMEGSGLTTGWLQDRIIEAGGPALEVLVGTHNGRRLMTVPMTKAVVRRCLDDLIVWHEERYAEWESRKDPVSRFSTIGRLVDEEVVDLHDSYDARPRPSFSSEAPAMADSEAEWLGRELNAKRTPKTHAQWMGDVGFLASEYCEGHPFQGVIMKACYAMTKPQDPTALGFFDYERSSWPVSVVLNAEETVDSVRTLVAMDGREVIVEQDSKAGYYILPGQTDEEWETLTFEDGTVGYQRKPSKLPPKARLVQWFGEPDGGYYHEVTEDDEHLLQMYEGLKVGDSLYFKTELEFLAIDSVKLSMWTLSKYVTTGSYGPIVPIERASAYDIFPCLKAFLEKASELSLDGEAAQEEWLVDSLRNLDMELRDYQRRMMDIMVSANVRNTVMTRWFSMAAEGFATELNNPGWMRQRGFGEFGDRTFPRMLSELWTKEIVPMFRNHDFVMAYRFFNDGGVKPNEENLGTFWRAMGYVPGNDAKPRGMKHFSRMLELEFRRESPYEERRRGSRRLPPQMMMGTDGTEKFSLGYAGDVEVHVGLAAYGMSTPFHPVNLHLPPAYLVQRVRDANEKGLLKALRGAQMVVCQKVFGPQMGGIAFRTLCQFGRSWEQRNPKNRDTFYLTFVKLVVEQFFSTISSSRKGLKCDKGEEAGILEMQKSRWMECFRRADRAQLMLLSSNPDITSMLLDSMKAVRELPSLSSIDEVRKSILAHRSEQGDVVTKKMVKMLG